MIRNHRGHWTCPILGNEGFYSHHRVFKTISNIVNPNRLLTLDSRNRRLIQKLSALNKFHDARLPTLGRRR